MKTKTYLLTGGTGFLGSYLGQKLVENGNKVIFLGRQKDNLSFENRILNQYKSDNLDKSLLSTIEVDFNKVNLGMSDEQIRILKRKKVYGLWHLAADLSFNENNRSRVFDINIGGMMQILKLSKLLNLKLFYVSTAYVHGKRPGKIYEDELIQPKSFNNPYEESKFIAEGKLRDWGLTHLKSFMIFRPSIIIEEKPRRLIFFGYYSIVFTFYKLKKSLINFVYNNPKLSKILSFRYDGKELKTPLVFFYSSSASLNLISLETVTESMIQISNNNLALGLTFHITNPNSIPMKTIIKGTLKALQMRFYVTKFPKGIISIIYSLLFLISQFVKSLRKIILKLITYKYYMLEYNSYDIKNTTSILGKKYVDSFPNPSERYIEEIAKNYLKSLDA